MNQEESIRSIEESERYFNKSTSELEEADSGFTPAEGTFTAAQHVAEVAVTLDWFIDGVFGGKGWNMNFDEHVAKVKAVSSLAVAREMVAQAFKNARTTVEAQSQEQLDEAMPADDPIMPASRRYNVVSAIADHTAHHRGALTVYTRLRGKTPPMPYM